MSNGDDDDLDCILGEWVPNKLVAMTESPQLTTRLLAEPAECRTGGGSTAELPPLKGRTGEQWGGDPCQGPCLPLANALSLHHDIYALLVT